MAKRIAVLFEPGRGGRSALDRAREVAQREHASLTVLTIVPQGASGARCGNSAIDYNQAMWESGEQDLRQARERLGSVGDSAAFNVLVDGSDPPLEQWIAAGEFELVLLPARRRLLGAARHPAATRLARVAGAEVQVVER
jgi:hypothetical protein